MNSYWVMTFQNFSVMVKDDIRGYLILISVDFLLPGQIHSYPSEKDWNPDPKGIGTS